MTEPTTDPSKVCLDFIDRLPARLAEDIRSRLLAFAGIGAAASDAETVRKAVRAHFLASDLTPLQHKGRILALRAFLAYTFDHTFSVERSRLRETRLGPDQAAQSAPGAATEAHALHTLYDAARPDFEALHAEALSDEAISRFEHSLWPSPNT